MPDPNECFATSDFGFGPFPEPGQSIACPGYPHGSGYGGVGYGAHSEGGTVYGLYRYGGVSFPAPPIAIDSGYGGDPYGLGSYGSSDKTPPQPIAAISLNGYEIEVFFSEEMDTTEPSLTSPTSYTLTNITGAPSTVVAVRVERLGPRGSIGDTTIGALSVILTHTGTTKGGTYSVMVQGPLDLAGNSILPNEVACLTKGEPPDHIVTILSGNELLITFGHPMLQQADEPPGTLVGILDVASYLFEAGYPITITPLEVVHPYQGDPAKVYLRVKGMTSIDYMSLIGPSGLFKYDPEVGLPDTDPGFQGVEIGTGTSSVTTGADAAVLMSRTRGNVYGWGFLNTQGTIIPHESTFNTDFEFNAGTTIYTPPLASFSQPQIGSLIVEDGPGGVRVTVTLAKALDGTDVILVTSGSFTQAVAAPWGTGTNVLSVTRNRKAGFYTVLFNNVPLVSAPIAAFDEPAQGQAASATWRFFDEAYDISGFLLRGMIYSASLSVYSAAWNYIHGESSGFTGSAALTRNYLDTKRGPLVKDWGDDTPATPQDVQVFVAGTEVDVADVNHWHGRVYLTVPIPLLPPADPQADVKVDYKWMASPTMTMRLGQLGAVLGKRARRIGDTTHTYHGEQIQDATHPKGAVKTSRFPMGVVLGGPDRVRPQPEQVGHRYMGFETAYSAVLGSPTTLRLGNAPMRSSVPGFRVVPKGVSVAYEGTTVPTADSWELLGVDGGAVNVGSGTYTLVDTHNGTLDPTNPQAVVYWKETDTTFPSAAYLVGRFTIDTTGTTPDGVFTGVGFGIHDNNRVYMAGALEINGVQHVGLLLNDKAPHLKESWLVGPTATLTITGKTSFTATTSTLPPDIAENDRFQILVGTQAGVYTISHVVHQTSGTSTVDVEEEFPADYTLYANQHPGASFEVLWGTYPHTYRLEVDPNQDVAVFKVSGAVTGTVAVADGTASMLSSPADMPFMLSTEYKGQVFWGSLNSLAVNTSTWSFFRYGVVPDQTAMTGKSIVVAADMDQVPEEDVHDKWFLSQAYGYSEILAGDRMLLKSTSAHDTLNYTFGYERIEPFLGTDASLDLRTKFLMDSGTRGSGDAQVVINDTVREVRLGTLLFIERPGQLEFRKLINIPQVSLSGVMDPAKQGWTEAFGDTLEHLAQGRYITTTQIAGSAGGFVKTLDLTNPDYVDTGSRILEARLAIDSYTPNGGPLGYIGVKIGMDVGPVGGPAETVKIVFHGGAVALADENDDVQQKYMSNWTDGGTHTYRVVADAISNTVTMFIDGVVQTPTVNLALFTGTGSSGSGCSFGAYNTPPNQGGAVDNTLTSVVRWYSVSCTGMPPVGAKRTLGIWTGGDMDHINSWEIPRTDATTAPNSMEVGPIVEEMDWRSLMQVRVLRDPNWGVTMFRPDLPLPPYYVGENPGVPGTGFITEMTEPSAGWINVEYSNLPLVPSNFGMVEFGALSPKSVTQQQWDVVYYRLFKPTQIDFIAPQKMTLGRYNVITSGERTKDISLETATVPVTSPTEASLRSAHLNADRIYRVQDGVIVLSSDMVSFDKTSQVITLLREADGTPRVFSSTSVTVTFAPGKPITETYLRNQPVADGVTTLNEGTPCIPRSQVADEELLLESGSIRSIGDPDGKLDDSTLYTDDPYQILTPVNPATARYKSMKFIQVSDGGQRGLIEHIGEGLLPEGFSGHSPDEGEDVYSTTGTGDPLNGAGACAGLFKTGDKVGKAVGAHVLALSGTAYHEHVPGITQDIWQGVGMAGSFLFASGGNYIGPVVDGGGNIVGSAPLGGTLGPGTSVLYPTFPAKNVGEGKIYRRVDWYIHLRSVLTNGAGIGPSSVGGSVGESVGGSAGGDVYWEVPLDEDVPPGSDNIPPTRGALWSVSPPGPPNPNGLGAVLMEMQSAGDYSRIGPWGGMSTLTPDRDFGFFELGTIPDGTIVEVREESGPLVYQFVARIVPVAPNEFAIHPSPHVNLANAINAHPGASQLVWASPGMTWAGVPSVLVTAYLPVQIGNEIRLASSDMSAIWTEDTLDGLLTGGSQITQSSLLAGGNTTLRGALHDPKLGIVCQGGSALPIGARFTWIINAAG